MPAQMSRLLESTMISPRDFSRTFPQWQSEAYIIFWGWNIPLAP